MLRMKRIVVIVSLTSRRKTGKKKIESREANSQKPHYTGDNITHSITAEVWFLNASELRFRTNNGDGRSCLKTWV